MGNRGMWWLQWRIVGRGGFLEGSWDVVASLGDHGTLWLQWGIVGCGGFDEGSWDVVASVGDRTRGDEGTRRDRECGDRGT